jgi:hypothetical protein
LLVNECIMQIVVGGKMVVSRAPTLHMNDLGAPVKIIRFVVIRGARVPFARLLVGGHGADTPILESFEQLVFAQPSSASFVRLSLV